MMLDNYPDTFTLVQIHVDDAYATPWGDARASFYSLYGTPTAWFDGVSEREGAYPNNIPAQYAWYEMAYNARRNTPTNITIRAGATELSSNTFRITAEVAAEQEGSTRDIRLHMVQLLDYWPSYPTYHRNTFKQAADTVDFSLRPGQSQVVENTFTFDGDSMGDRTNIKIVVWAQQQASHSPAEVFQAAMLSWPFPPFGEDIPGDINGDGQVDETDRDLFVGVLIGTESNQEYIERSDLNGDGVADGNDIQPFVGAFLNGP